MLTQKVQTGLANAGYAREGHSTLGRFVNVYADYEKIIVLSGSCAVHVRLHAGEIVASEGMAETSGTRVAKRTTEFCAFLHDDVGVAALAALDARFEVAARNVYRTRNRTLFVFVWLADIEQHKRVAAF